MIPRGLLLGLALIQMLASATGVALADIGVGVGSEPIALGQPALTGETYAMTPFYVVNTGTEPGRYSLSVQRLSPGEEPPAPPEWITLGENDFLLAPQESRYVTVTLSVPPDAAAGPYLTNVMATAGSPAQPVGGAALGAAAATKLVFTVAQSPPSILLFIRALPPWAPIAGGGLIAIIALVLLLRSLGISIQVQRHD